MRKHRSITSSVQVRLHSLSAPERETKKNARGHPSKSVHINYIHESILYTELELFQFNLMFPTKRKIFPDAELSSNDLFIRNKGFREVSKWLSKIIF